jgi:membrane-associated protease RseP (regulator of RpoE activity)
MKVAFPAILLAFVLIPGGLGAGAPQAEPVSVPFEVLKSRHIVVQIKVNGKGPYRVIFDTGAPITLVTRKVAKEAGIGPGSTALFGPEARIKSLQLGGIDAKDLPVVVLDHPTLKLIAKAFGPLEGIVGFSFFGRYRMTLDYQAKKMTFVPVAYRPPNMIDQVTSILSADQKKVLAPGALLGFRIRPRENDKEPGLTVAGVFPGSAAARAGLQAGDRLLTLDGRWTDSLNDLYAAAGFLKPGSTAQLVVRRGDRQIQISVKPRTGL